MDVALIQSGMRAHLRRPDIKVGNDSDGIKLSSLVDSLAYDDGADTRANIRKFGMNADIRKVIVNGEPSPHVVITNTDDKIFIRSGDSRIRLRNASIGLQADRRERRSNPQRERRRHVLDSLRRLYPGAPRDSIFALAGFKRRGLDEFASKDFKLELDASLLKLYDEWKPGGMIAAENVRVFSPSLPLRTRVNNISASLDDDDATIIGLDAKCGSSDIKLSGDMGGLRRFLRGRAPLKFTFNLDSDRINLNEIMLAMQKSQSDTTVVSSSETDEGFVLEGLEDSEYQGGMDMKAVIVPRNLSGSINLKAKRIDYTSVTVSPVVGQLNIDKRILQIKELKADTNLGSVDLDAFYATKSKVFLGNKCHIIVIIPLVWEFVDTFPACINVDFPQTSCRIESGNHNINEQACKTDHTVYDMSNTIIVTDKSPHRYKAQAHTEHQSCQYRQHGSFKILLYFFHKSTLIRLNIYFQIIMKVLPADIPPAAHESSEKASAHGLMLPELILVLFYKRP